MELRRRKRVIFLVNKVWDEVVVSCAMRVADIKLLVSITLEAVLKFYLAYPSFKTLVCL